MSNIKELMREKIDSFYAEYKAKFHQNGDSYHMGIIDGLDMAERILDTMPDEPVTDFHDLEEEIDLYMEKNYDYNSEYDTLTPNDGFFFSPCHFRNLARHFAKWGADHLRDATKKISEDLEEAAENSRVPEDAWQTARQATKTLNAMNLGIKFYGNLFPYLRKRGKLPLCCKKQGRLWLYETDKIAWLVKNGKLDYKQTWI